MITNDNAMVNHGIGSNETTLTNVSTTNGHATRIEVVGHHPWTHVSVVSNLTPSGNDRVVTQRDVIANDSIARTTYARVDDTVTSHDGARTEFDVITYDTAISNHDAIMDVAEVSDGHILPDLGARMDDGI